MKGRKSKSWAMAYCGMAAALSIAFMLLGWTGVQAPTPSLTLLSQVCTFLYFAYFILMPFYTRMEKTKPVPERVTG